MKFNINDEVKIISGEYKNYKGIILKVDNDNKKILVQVMLFEKNEIIELNMNDVINLEYE